MKHISFQQEITHHTSCVRMIDYHTTGVAKRVQWYHHASLGSHCAKDSSHIKGLVLHNKLRVKYLCLYSTPSGTQHYLYGTTTSHTVPTVQLITTATLLLLPKKRLSPALRMHCLRQNPLDTPLAILDPSFFPELWSSFAAHRGSWFR